MLGECGSEGTQEMLRIFPVRACASRNVREPMVNQERRRAQSRLSKRAPVRYHRAIQARVLSWQAVIFVASRGVRRVRSSSSVRVQTRDAMRAPPEVPVMMVGRRPVERCARMTPKW